MTTQREDNSFIEAVIDQSLLEMSITWIKENLAPEDVFTHQQLHAWADQNNLVVRED